MGRGTWAFRTAGKPGSFLVPAPASPWDRREREDGEKKGEEGEGGRRAMEGEGRAEGEGGKRRGKGRREGEGEGKAEGETGEPGRNPFYGLQAGP